MNVPLSYDRWVSIVPKRCWILSLPLRLIPNFQEADCHETHRPRIAIPWDRGPVPGLCRHIHGQLASVSSPPMYQHATWACFPTSQLSGPIQSPLTPSRQRPVDLGRIIATVDGSFCTRKSSAQIKLPLRASARAARQ